MRSYPPPQVGFNNNVKHRGRVFHIQTEDSGVNRPYITTLLFVDGGRIIKSERTDYSDMLSQADLVAKVRRCMKEQHKSMFISLREGELDEVIDELFAPKSMKVVGGGGANGASVGLPHRSTGAVHSAAPKSATNPASQSAEVNGASSSSGIRRPTLSTDNLMAVGHPQTSVRPEARFSNASSTASLFGNESLSEQSLDDVILSYISEDLDGTPEK